LKWQVLILWQTLTERLQQDQERIERYKRLMLLWGSLKLYVEKKFPAEASREDDSKYYFGLQNRI
jgi:hypothetical protein